MGARVYEDLELASEVVQHFIGSGSSGTGEGLYMYAPYCHVRSGTDVFVNEEQLNLVLGLKSFSLDIGHVTARR